MGAPLMGGGGGEFWGAPQPPPHPPPYLLGAPHGGGCHDVPLSDLQVGFVEPTEEGVGVEVGLLLLHVLLFLAVLLIFIPFLLLLLLTPFGDPIYGTELG